jgi:hypothetical protein
VIERTVTLLQDRVYDPAREVEVERDGTWSPALQRSWQLWDDGRGWVAEVEWTERYYWGIRTVVAMVPADRVRLEDAAQSWAPEAHIVDWMGTEHLTALSA